MEIIALLDLYFPHTFDVSLLTDSGQVVRLCRGDLR